MVDDPSETFNIIDTSDPEIITQIREMREKLLSKLRQINDPVLH